MIFHLNKQIDDHGDLQYRKFINSAPFKIYFKLNLNNPAFRNSSLVLKITGLIPPNCWKSMSDTLMNNSCRYAGVNRGLKLKLRFVTPNKMLYIVQKTRFTESVVTK